MLLRTAALSKLERKQAEFSWMKKVHAAGVPIPEPIRMNVTEEVQSFFRWCDGEDAEGIVPTLPKVQQYQFGWQSGAYLRQIHAFPAPATVVPWEEKFSRKIDRKIAVYQDCPLSFVGDEAILQYISFSRHLIEGRPQTFQHGDFHTGNMVISAEGTLSIIDFDRFDFGDPWEEFNRIVFTAALSPEFASGQLHGYFEGEPPETFFQLLALYIACNTLSGLPWALEFGEAEIATMQAQAEQVLEWYENMTRVVPTWYQSQK